MRTPQSEGRTVQRRDVTPGSSGLVMTHELINVRTYFDAIKKQMAKDDPAARVRYMRGEEEPITLKDIIDLGIACDREIGIYVDLFKLDPSKKKTDRYTGDSRYTCICLFAGSRIFKHSRTGESAVGASVTFPPGGKERYRIIAHYHPTESCDAYQLKTDLEVANEQLEMVVNKTGLILFYKNAVCYNQKVVTRGHTSYGSALSEKFDEAPDNFLRSLTPETPITLATVQSLDAAKLALDALDLKRIRGKFPTITRAGASAETGTMETSVTSPRASDKSDEEDFCDFLKSVTSI